MDTSLISFGQLVARRVSSLDRGGDAAIGSLIDLTGDRLVRYSIAITRHQHDAEDAVQTVFVRLTDRPTHLTAADDPWAYLLRMVRNESLRVVARSSRMTLLRTLSDLVTRCPVDHLQNEERYAEVWRCLRRLPAEQSEVVVLKIWEQMTFAQIAGVTDQSPDTVEPSESTDE